MCGSVVFFQDVLEQKCYVWLLWKKSQWSNVNIVHYCSFVRQWVMKDASTLPDAPSRSRLLCAQSKQNLQETQAVWIASCLAYGLLKLKRLVNCVSIAGYAECNEICVVWSCHILAIKICYVIS